MSCRAWLVDGDYGLTHREVVVPCPPPSVYRVPCIPLLASAGVTEESALPERPDIQIDEYWYAGRGSYTDRHIYRRIRTTGGV